MKLSPAREAAFVLLLSEAWEKGQDWDRLLERQLASPSLSDPRDRRLFSQLVAGTLRMRGRLDARLRRLTGRDRFDSVVLWALRLALFQLEEMDRLPAHAVLSEAVELVKRRRGKRLAGWVNAQLRNWQRQGIPGRGPDPDSDPLSFAVEELSYPVWLAERWLRELGPDRAFALMRAMNTHFSTDFRWNALRPGFEDFLKTLEESGTSHRILEGLPLGLRLEGAWPEGIRRALDRGELSVQDEAAQRVVPLLLAPGVAGPWAELCSAPGGKVSQLAELTGDQEEIFALDIDDDRLENVHRNADRLGLKHVQAQQGDLLDLRPRPVAGLLLDAPCSALGVLSANPDARWRKSEAQILERAGLQRRMLAAAADWVRPGGRLVYAVCTLTPEETRDQRRWFLERFTEFRHEPVTSGELPERFRDPEGDLMIWPQQGGGAGHYAARFRRADR